MKAKLAFYLAAVLMGSLTLVCAEDTNAVPIQPVLTATVSSNGKTNVQHMPFEAIADSNAKNIEKFFLSSTNTIPTNFTTAAPIIGAMTKTNLKFIREVEPEMIAAADFLKGLKMQGRLPGMSADSHGTPTSELTGTNIPTVSYPFSMTLNICPQGELFTNHYTAIKLTPNGAWQLKKAWKTDVVGKTVMEWPVK